MSTLYSFRDDDLVFHYSLDDQPSPEDFPMHAHEMHEIFYFMSGKGKYGVEGSLYPLEPGSILLMRSGETHKLNISPDYPYERISLHFNPEFLRLFDPEKKLLQAFNDRPLGQRNLYNENNFRKSPVYDCLKGMVCLSDSSYYKKLAIISNLTVVLYEITGSFLNEQHKNIPIAHNASIRNVINYINLHIGEDLSLDGLSSQFFISKSYLNRQFKKITGSTVWEYIIIKRLLWARQQIRNGLPATEVCTLTGFHDYSAFFRAYKRHFSVSPLSDRLMIK